MQWGGRQPDGLGEISKSLLSCCGLPGLQSVSLDPCQLYLADLSLRRVRGHIGLGERDRSSACAAAAKALPALHLLPQCRGGLLRGTNATLPRGNFHDCPHRMQCKPF